MRVALEFEKSLKVDTIIFSHDDYGKTPSMHAKPGAEQCRVAARACVNMCCPQATMGGQLVKSRVGCTINRMCLVSVSV